MDEYTTNLLNAEAAVEELQTELRKLTDEVGSYASASRSLDEAQHAIKQLVDKHAQLTQQTAAVIGKLGEIGTPQVLQGLEQLTEQQGGVLEVNRSLKQQVSKDMAAVKSYLGASEKKFVELNAALQDWIAQTLKGNTSKLTESTSQLKDEMAVQIKRLNDSHSDNTHQLIEVLQRLESQTNQQVQESKTAQGTMDKRHHLQTTLLGIAIAAAFGAIILAIPAVQRLIGG